MRKLKTGFTEYSASQLANLAERVGAAVALIPKFSGVTPTPAVIAAQAADLREKMAANGPGAKTAMHTAMATLAASLSLMATNLNDTAGVTETDLAETLFPMAKERERTTQRPQAPDNLQIKHGPLSGQVVGRCRLRERNIRWLEIQWAFEPNAGPWIDGEPTSNSRELKLEGLERGKDIWVRVRARNVVGAGAWSDPATIMVM
jgi:hypothetical protein